jgi:hypothetical protein
MEALKNQFHSRIRNQMSNIILFGSVIGLTALGLVAGTIAGVLLVGRTGVHEWPPVVQPWATLVVISPVPVLIALTVFTVIGDSRLTPVLLPFTPR